MQIFKNMAISLRELLVGEKEKMWFYIAVVGTILITILVVRWEVGAADAKGTGGLNAIHLIYLLIVCIVGRVFHLMLLQFYYARTLRNKTTQLHKAARNLAPLNIRSASELELRLREVFKDDPQFFPFTAMDSSLVEIATAHDNRGTIEAKNVEEILEERFYVTSDKLDNYIKLFVLLGLLGTVIGLSGSVFELSSILNSTTGGSSSGLDMGKFSQVFSQMRGAFGTTIAGIAATILFSVSNARCFRRYEASLNTFHSCIRTDILPLYVPDRQENILKDIKDGFHSAARKMEVLSDKIMSQAERQDESDRRLSAAMISFNRGSKSFQESSAKMLEMQDSVRMMVNHIQLMAEDSKKIQEEFSNEFQKVFAQQMFRLDQLGQSNAGMLEILQKNVQDERELYDAIAKLNNKLDISFETLQQSFDRGFLGTQEKVVSGIGQLNSEVGTNLTGITGALGQIGGEIADRLSDLEGMVDRINSQAADAIESQLKSMRNEMKEQLELLVTNSDGIATGFSGSLENMQSIFGDVGKSLTSGIDKMNRILDQNKERQLQIDGRINEAIDEFQLLFSSHEWYTHVKQMMRGNRKAAVVESRQAEHDVPAPTGKTGRKKNA